MTDFNPYEAPSAVLADPDNGEHLELAERGTRLGARILDGLIFGLGFVLIGILAAILIPAFVSRRAGSASSIVAMVVLVVLALGLMVALMAWNLVWLHRHGQTIAKRLLKIRIVQRDGSSVGMGRLLGIRILLLWVIESIPLLGPLFSLVNACFIFRDDRRCIHDLMADTIVVKVPH
jgi:uncharacterized RDD family membrane protein YckC